MHTRMHVVYRKKITEREIKKSTEIGKGRYRERHKYRHKRGRGRETERHSSLMRT